MNEVFMLSYLQCGIVLSIIGACSDERTPDSMSTLIRWIP